MKFRNFFKINLLLFFIILLSSNLYAEDFSDLEETRIKVYGSEKDKKYRLDGFFIEWENWPRDNPTHNHFHFFWFANTTNYPKFKKNQIFPFFSSIESKVDSRKSTNYLLLYNSSVDRKGNENVILFPFYYSGNNNENNSNYLGIFPLFYKSNLNLNSYVASKLILPGFYNETINDSKNNESSNFTLSPFYVSNSSKSSTNLNSISWFPIIPLYYTSEDKETIHKNIAWIFDSNENKTTQKVDRFWFLPFFYWKKDQYLNIFPIYFNKLSKSGETDEWFGIILPIYRSYSPEHSTFYFLNYFKSTENLTSTKDSFTTIFPFYFQSDNTLNESFTMLPILYLKSQDKDNSTHMNLLMVYDQAIDKDDKLDRLWLMPFYFYKKNTYNYIVPFFFQNSNNNKVKEEDEIISNSWFGIIPPIYRSYSQKHSTFYLINFLTTYKKDNRKEESVTTFFPFYFHFNNTLKESMTLLPILYYNKREKSLDSHTNLLIVYDQVLDKDDNLDRMWLMPFYFYKRNSYRYIIPFYFGNDDTTKSKDSVTWGPFYYIRNSEKVQEKYFLLYYEHNEEGKIISNHITNVFPFYYSWDSKNSNIIQGSTDTEKGFYIFPLFYNNQNTKGDSYSNLLGLVSWTKDKDDDLIQNTIFPFRFYKKDNYSVWFPFSFQFGKTESTSDTGKRWGAFFYSSWSPEEEKLWIVNYYSNEDKKNDYQSKTFFPFYHSWKKENSNGSLVFPIYIDADFRDEKEKDKFNNFSLNILGIASQTSKGIFQPSFSVDGGKKSKYYYLDTDISWLYYAFRISNRTSNKFIKDLLPGEKSDASEFKLIDKNSVSNSPKVNYKKSFTREDSFNFIGVNILFGVFGYEAADTKRHIRLLPLAWFTYDTELDENIYAGPLPLPFVWYSSADLKYRVIFPIYGYQNSEDAERHSYGLFLFLKEAILENNTVETSVIWPFINWHKSDIKTGSRVLPFYWQRTTYENKQTSDSTLIPVGLTYINKTSNDQNISKDTWISPFLFRTDQFFEDGKIERIYSPLALFYWSETQTSKKEDLLFISPVFFKYQNYLKSKKIPEITNFWMIPIVGFESKTKENYWLNYILLYNKSKSPNEESLLVFPFYNENKLYDKGELINQSHFYFPLFPIVTNHKLISNKNNVDEFNIISPFLFSTSISTNEDLIYSEKLYPIPLFYSEYDKKSNSNFMSLLLLFQYESNSKETTYRFFPLIQFSSSEEKPDQLTDNKNWFLPFFWKANKKILNKDKKIVEENSFVSLPYTSFSSEEEDIKILPLLFYYSNTSPKESFQSLFLLANHTNNSEKEIYNFFPLFHYSSSKPIDSNLIQKDNTSTSDSITKPKDNSYRKSNLYYTNRFFPFYSYNTIKNSEDKFLRSEFTSIFYTSTSIYSTRDGLISSKFWIPFLLYSNETTTTSSNWTWLFLIQSEGTQSESSFDIFPIFHTSKESNKFGSHSKNWLFPLYYFNTKVDENNKDTDSVTVLPFLFYYSSSDYEEEYQNWLLLYNHKENTNSISYNFFPLYHYYSTKPDTKYIQEYENWLFPFYSYENRKTPEGKNISSDFLSIFYASSSNYSDKGELISSMFWIPIALYSNETTPTSSEWSWLFFIQSKSTANKDTFNLYPIFHASSSTESDATKKISDRSKNWLFPVYYYSSYLLSKEENDYETTYFFPIIPIIYREASNSSSHTNLFYLFDRKEEENSLKRFFLFPFYYSNDDPINEKSTSYFHLFPIYFSGIDNNEYTAFITGLYINSNTYSNYKNLLFLIEQESRHDSKENEFNMLLRSIHFESSPTITNFKLLYGIGELDLKPMYTQMNLAWLSYEKTENTSYLNLLPLYFNNESKYNTTDWITPLLFYSNTTDKKKLQHSTLGLIYYNSENFETKESLQNILLGIIYYKTVKPKERGYIGRGSLWGALWEYNTEEETNYSKFSILKILYSRREDGDGVRHRILLFEF